jgi:hypothetical protein
MRAGPQLRVDACGVRRYGSVMPVCMQPVATLTLQTFAKVFLGRRLHSHDEQSLSSNYLTIYLALFKPMYNRVYKF